MHMQFPMHTNAHVCPHTPHKRAKEQYFLRKIASFFLNLKIFLESFNFTNKIPITMTLKSPLYPLYHKNNLQHWWVSWYQDPEIHLP